MILNDWDEVSGLSQCIITETNNSVTLQGYGCAQCHDSDFNFKSSITGEFIAQTRAQIDILRHKRDYDIKPGLFALKHLLSTMINSKNYNPKSYESLRLKREIKHYEDDLKLLNNTIKEAQVMLKSYIDQKDKIYRKAENK